MVYYILNCVVDCLYISNDEGGKGLISNEGCIKREEKNLGWYTKNLTENWIKSF